MVVSLQVIASKRRGGAESMFCRLGGALVQRGHPTTAVVRDGSMLTSMLDARLPYRSLPMSSYVDLRTVWRLRSLARERQASVIQSWMSRATWLTRAPRGSVHVARIGGYYRPRYFRHAHAWVVNTRGLRDWLVQEGFPADRVEWIGNFVAPPRPGQAPPFTRASLGIPEDALVVAAMGRLIPKKGFQDLLPAFAELPARIDGRDVHLLLMGQGPDAEGLRRLAAPVAGRVHFTGWVEDAVRALPLADVFVCPSREEPYGNVLIEAWSLGLPVLSTRSDGGRELIDDGDNGLLCAVADPADLRHGLLRLLESRALREQLAGRGRERYLQRHDEEGVVQAYLDFYERLRRRYA